MEKGDSSGLEAASSASQHEPAVYFSNSVLGANDSVTGVVVGRIAVSTLKEIVSEGEPFQMDLIDRDHRLIFSTREAGQGTLEFGAPFPDDLVLNELQSGKPMGFVGRHTLSETGTHYTAFATENGDGDFKGNGWTVVLWVPGDYIAAPLGELKRSAVTFLFLAILLSLLSSSYLGRLLSRPLKKISYAAKQVGQGKLDVNIDYHQQDEFGELADAFTTMAADLKAAKVRLDDYSDELEQKVRTRTLQLEESTKKAKALQEITLSILEDTNETKLALTNSNASLKMAQLEVLEFASNLEERVNERTKELAAPLQRFGPPLTSPLSFPEKRWGRSPSQAARTTLSRKRTPVSSALSPTISPAHLRDYRPLW